MIEISLHIFLFGYIFFLAIFAFFFIVNLLHLIGTGTFTRPSMFITGIMIAMSLIVFEITWELVSTVDLSQPLTFDLSQLGEALTQGLSN